MLHQPARAEYVRTCDVDPLNACRARQASSISAALGRVATLQQELQAIGPRVESAKQALETAGNDLADARNKLAGLRQRVADLQLRSSDVYEAYASDRLLATTLERARKSIDSAYPELIAAIRKLMLGQEIALDEAAAALEQTSPMAAVILEDLKHVRDASPDGAERLSALLKRCFNGKDQERDEALTQLAPPTQNLIRAAIYAQAMSTDQAQSLEVALTRSKTALARSEKRLASARADVSAVQSQSYQWEAWAKDRSINQSNAASEHDKLAARKAQLPSLIQGELNAIAPVQESQRVDACEALHCRSHYEREPSGPRG